ncbi:hypothetical protein J2S08_001740 [Bacillus chungangensis]|uniref:Uncharacterized protein n=1 Tax=Bacillus chungangensis TaxID=587633 RepID=A0ABT9WRP9_9BACI|nr:hypothetical protein [Bacillus chungangensis]
MPASKLQYLTEKNSRLDYNLIMDFKKIYVCEIPWSNRYLSKATSQAAYYYR